MCLDCGCGMPGDDHGDPRHITTTTLLDASGANGGTLSLGQIAANIVSGLMFPPASPDGSGPLQGVTPADAGLLEVLKSVGAAEQRYVLGVAYQAGRDERISKGLDGARDFFTPAELEKAAWEFLANGPVVGLFHVDGTEGAATVVESYIYRGPEWDLGDVVVKSGTWLLGAILDEQAWGLMKAGKITGWSPQGTATRRRTAAA